MPKRSVYKKKRKHRRDKPSLTPENIKFLKQESRDRLAYLNRIKGQRKARVKAIIKIKSKGLKDKGRERLLLRKCS